MSFVYSATRLVCPKVPSFIPGPNTSTDVWIGQNADAGLAVARIGTQWRMFHAENGAANVVPSIVVDGNELAPVFREVGGSIYWASATAALYFADGFGWVYMDGGAPGYIPVEYTDDRDRYKGDEFYVLTTTPYAEGAIMKLTARGRLTGQADKTASYSWKRWDGPKAAAPFGEYTGAGGESGSKFIGLPQWVDGDGKYYTRSLTQEDSHWVYGDVHFGKDKWLIGSEGNAAGWHEGSEPTKTGSTVFRFCVPPGSEVTGTDITLTFSGYVEGSNQKEMLLGEVAIWH